MKFLKIVSFGAVNNNAKNPEKKYLLSKSQQIEDNQQNVRGVKQ